MDAILLAGGVPDSDSLLYPYTQGKPKADVEIGGKPMIQWVLDALEKSNTIDNIVVVGCEDMGDSLKSSKIISYQPAEEDIILNFQRGADAVLDNDPTAESVAIVSSDIPLLTPESVNWLVNTTRDGKEDIFYCVIDQLQMEKRFPTSNRSYIKLRDINVCGGDMTIINLSLYKDKNDFWRKIFKARKSYLHQAALIGFDILIMLILRRLTLDDIVKKVTRRLDISGRGLICPYPELGMDIDKPHQLKIAREELGQIQ